jgi:hypothetical protein
MTEIHEICIECTPDCECHDRLRLMYHAGISEDVSEYDLKQRYTDYNRELFSGQLPDIKIDWATLKSAGGRVLYKIMAGARPYAKSPVSGEDVIEGTHKGRKAFMIPGSLKMQISNLYKRSDQALDALLLHEMIHVYFAVTGQFDEQHGPNFRSMASDLSSRVGFEVPMKDKVDGLDLMSEDTKEVGVILFDRGDRYSFSIISPKLIQQEYMVQSAAQYLRRVSIYRINSKIWTKMAMKYPVQRVINRNLKVYRLENKDALDDLLQNGKLLIGPERTEITAPERVSGDA